MTVPSLDPILVTTTATPPDVKQLTSGSVDGTGVYDVLMKAVAIQLNTEYDEGRITGQEYATVYVGAIGAVLQSAISFLNNHQQEKLIAAQIALTRQKTVTELAQTDNDIPLGLGFNGSQVIEGMVAAELALKEKQGTLADNQILSVKAEKDLYGQKIISELAQTDNGIAQARAAGYGFNDADTVSGALEGANITSLMNAKLVEQKVATELAATSDTKPAELGESSSTTISGTVGKQNTLITNQGAKVVKESELIAQKTATELAQTSDTIPAGVALNPVTTVSGSIAKQKALYTAQTDGFARDAEQKVAKMLLESWNVSATLGVATANATNRLDDPSLGSAMTKLREGVGLT